MKACLKLKRTHISKGSVQELKEHKKKQDNYYLCFKYTYIPIFFFTVTLDGVSKAGLYYHESDNTNTKHSCLGFGKSLPVLDTILFLAQR